jgi:hypothetical protein
MDQNRCTSTILLLGNPSNIATQRGRIARITTNQDLDSKKGKKLDPAMDVANQAT